MCTKLVPEIYLPPDLGPKSYIAHGVKKRQPPNDSITRMHDDMSDAVNVLLYSTKTDGEGKEDLDVGAEWQIWRRPDKRPLMDWLWANSKTIGYHDDHMDHPVHDHANYLTWEDQAKMAEDTGVHGWTFVQHEGEGVFIPAGCVHQVRNTTCCLKVAMDFVSPEGILSCLTRTAEQRTLPTNHAHKEDKLQAKLMLLQSAEWACQAIKDEKLGKSRHAEEQEKAASKTANTAASKAAKAKKARKI